MNHLEFSNKKIRDFLRSVGRFTGSRPSTGVRKPP
jgi:hypothetical protein